MNNSLAQISTYLTGQHLSNVSVEALQKLANEHPYFAVTQFLLAKKLKENDDPLFLKQAQKTALYFSNYYLLDDNLTQVLSSHEEAKSRQQEVSLVEEEVSMNRTSETTEHNKTSDATIQTTTPQDDSDEHETMFRNIKAMLDADAAEANAEVGNAPVPIDPYYTIDYFASQGIKLDFEQNPQDQLGKKLKKFTHWLRHMKKLGPEDAIESMVSTETETQIQRIAESSNTAKEVVTEAMASVLEKQGKKAKAIELYEKLSFLYPHKSPYFAARINNLKDN